MGYTPGMNETPSYPNPWHPDDEAYWNPVRRAWSFTKTPEIPKELEKLMWSGKLSQMCPYCKTVEPAGGYCSKCGRQVTPASYFKQQSLNEDGTPRRGRPKKGDQLAMVGVLYGNT